MKFRWCSLCSVADPHHFDTDQEPDPVPACNFRVRIWILLVTLMRIRILASK
jgi:hypothetical protein